MTTRQSNPAQFVHVTTLDGIVTAAPVGPSIGERESIIINEHVAEALKPLGKSLRALVLDMSKVDYMPSVGIGMCVDLHNRAKAAKAPAIVVGLNDNLKQLFTMLKLTRVFKMVDDDVALDKELSRLK